MTSNRLIPQSSEDFIPQPCALCKKEAELQLSHRIPKAVGNIIKKRSFTKKLRNVSNPEQSVQDLDKDYQKSMQSFSPEMVKDKDMFSFRQFTYYFAAVLVFYTILSTFFGSFFRSRVEA